MLKNKNDTTVQQDRNLISITKQLKPYKEVERIQLKEINKTGERTSTKNSKKEQNLRTEENVYGLSSF